MIHSENRLAPRMVLIITNHEYRRKLEQTFQNFRIPIYYQCQGHGTAPSEMLDIFGLSGSGRLLTIGLLPKFLVRDLLDALQQRIPLHKRGGGIVLTIPITGLQRPMLQLLNDQMRETIEQKIEERVDSDMSDMQTSAGYAAIWVALSNGYSSDAIDAARNAGAMGGTILKGRRQNSERISRKLGISMQEEEEFVVIVTPREKKAAVMNAISDACGLRTDAHGIILSLPVDEVIARDMLQELKAYPLLTGYRGRECGDVDAACAAIAAFSRAVLALGDTVQEVEVNPLLVRGEGQGVCMLDALVIAAPGATG